MNKKNRFVLEYSNGDKKSRKLWAMASIAPANQGQVRTAITRLKNKDAGAEGLPTELFKPGGEELLIRCMHQLIRKSWLYDCMPVDWSVLCPIFRKDDPSNLRKT